MNKTAMITGGAAGIGRACALALADEGFFVVIADLDEAGAQDTVRKIRSKGGAAHAYGADVTDLDTMALVIKDVECRVESVDVLVNNAGLLNQTKLDDLTESEWDKVMAVNCKSAVFLSKSVLAGMRQKKWGRIIHMSSMSGRMGGIATGCAYAASKAALIGLSMCMARECAKDGITVNAIAPGPTDSTLFQGFSEPLRAQLAASIPVGRLGSPDEIAHVVRFLVSKKAGFITGAVIDINGGRFMG